MDDKERIGGIQHQPLAYHYYNPNETDDVKASSTKSTPLQRPVVLFCVGYRSSMSGIKALALEDHCKEKGIPYCRFDYRGHGESSRDDFLDLTLSDWIRDAESMLTNILFTQHEKVILVGSSMGAWIAFHLALMYPERIIGILCLASAVDFTQDVYLTATDEQKCDWQTTGIAYLPSQYQTEPYPMTQNLIRDAQEKWLLMDKGDPIPIKCPVRLLHGQNDDDISWEKSLRLAELLESKDVVLTLIKAGDHRLSKPGDLKRMLAALDDLIQ
jgi:pimeloyl-ACP methyl ester carboxylesterase